MPNITTFVTLAQAAYNQREYIDRHGHMLITIIIIIIIISIIFTGSPAGTGQIQGLEQLQQKKAKLSVVMASQMAITSYHSDRVEMPP